MRYKDLNRVLAEVSKYYEIEIEDIKGDCRKSEVTEARRMYCYLSREHTNNTFKKIAELINKDHSSAIYHSRFVEQRLEMPFNRELRREVAALGKLVSKDTFKNKLRDSANKIRQYTELIKKEKDYIKSL